MPSESLPTNPTDQNPPTAVPTPTAQPTPTFTSKSDDFFDDLLTPARGGEEFNESFIASDLANAEDTPKVAFSEPSSENVIVENLEAVAVENCRIAMDMRENLQAYGLSLYVDGNISEFAKYVYAPAQKENLVRAWSRVFKEHNIRIPAYLDIVQAELFATSPLLGLAIGNRKLRKEKEALQAELEQYKNATPGSVTDTPKTTAHPYGRADIKTLWIVDNEGFFEYTKRAGKFVRLKKSEKKTRPVPSGESLDRLIRYNGTDKIKDIYNL